MSEKQFLLVGGAVVLVFLLLFGYLSYEEWGKYGTLQTEITALDGEIQNFRDKIAKIKDLRQKLTEYEKRFERMRKILPNKAERENLIDVLNYLCSETGMNPPDSVAPEEKAGNVGRRKAQGDIQPIYYTVRLTGPFFAFVKFTNWLEHYKRHVRLKTFTVAGGGETESAGRSAAKLSYTVKLVSYQYTGDKGAESEAPLELEAPDIPEDEQYDPAADERRDPFVFPLIASPTTPVGPKPPGGNEHKVEGPLVRELNDRLEQAKILRRDVRRLGPAATTDQLRSIVQRHKKLDEYHRGVRPLGTASAKVLGELRNIVADIGGQIQFVWQRLLDQRVAEVLKVQDDHLENRRYADVVAPMLGLVNEFKSFALNDESEKQFRKVFAKTTHGLTQLVEELSEYEQAITLITRIDQEMGALRASPVTEVYRVFLDGKVDADGNRVGGLGEIKKKAEDIRLFRDVGILVTGLIWRPVEGDRICIVRADRLSRVRVGERTFERRLFGEGDVIGYLKNESDTVTIKEITKFKKVIFRFRGLSIAQELGDPKPAR